MDTMDDAEHDLADVIMRNNTPRDHVIAFSDDEIRIVSQALAYFESHMRGVAGSAAKIGWNDSAKGYERKVDATERLRDRIRKEAF